MTQSISYDGIITIGPSDMFEAFSAFEQRIKYQALFANSMAKVENQKLWWGGINQSLSNEPSYSKLTLPVLKQFIEDMTPTTEQPVLTPGQEAMDINFNGDREDIIAIKQIHADCFDAISGYVNAKTNGPDMLSAKSSAAVKRLEALAKTQLEFSCMLAVKAITK